MRWAGHVERIGERRGVYRVVWGKPEGKRLLGGRRRRWGIILTFGRLTLTILDVPHC